MSEHKSKKVWEVKCAVPSCGGTKRKYPELVFFKFPPQDDEMCKKWLEACSLQERPSSKLAYVCSLHFGINDVGKKRFKHQPLLPTLNLTKSESNVNVSVGFKVAQENCYSSKNHVEPLPICETQIIEQPIETVLISTDNQAAEYLRTLEEYCILKENFQAIGLIAQLEQLFKGKLEA